MPKIDIVNGNVELVYTRFERNGKVTSQRLINKVLDVKRRNPRISKNELILFALAEKNAQGA